MRVADYVFRHLADIGVRHVHLVTGGGAMFLNDALRGEPRIQPICQHHEQACAMAAEGYARVTGTPGVVSVTTGPGGINALNGVFGAWTDSIPMLVVSGQVKRETCMSSYPDLPLRQLGDQEADIISMVRGITKYAVQVTDPATIRYHLERAWYLAQSGRPGPCWLDIPIDVQSSQVEPADLLAYDSREDAISYDRTRLAEQCRKVLNLLQKAKRPVIMVGTGVRLAKAEAVFAETVRKLGIPVTTAWTAHDLVASDAPLYCGRPGTVGDRAGNFTVQNADVLLVMGSRLNIRQVSYNWQSFARCAFKIQVDVDETELNKPTAKPDLPVHCDLKQFLEEMGSQIGTAGFDPSVHAAWLSWCRGRVGRYPVLSEHRPGAPGKLNPYHFVASLFEQLTADDAVVCGNGSACVVPFQVARIQQGMRMFANSGCASMGYDLPAAIGAAVAREGKRVICLAGDGSLQMNLQELQTVVHHQLPIKLFVLNNGGYLSMRSTQRSFFARFIGEGPDSGLTFPDMVAVGRAYGLPAFRLDQPDFAAHLQNLLAMPGPVLCDVVLDPEQEFEPRLRSKQLPDGKLVAPPLEDMYPFLTPEELAANRLEGEAV